MQPASDEATKEENRNDCSGIGYWNAIQTPNDYIERWYTRSGFHTTCFIKKLKSRGFFPVQIEIIAQSIRFSIQRLYFQEISKCRRRAFYVFSLSAFKSKSYAENKGPEIGLA